MERSFQAISLFFVLSGIICAFIILFYIFPRRRQAMKIMEAVWPLTGLWANWIGLWAYLRIGIEKKNASVSAPPSAGMTKQQTPADSSLPDMNQMPGMNQMRGMESMADMEPMTGMGQKAGMQMPTRPRWQSITLSTLHCGAGCTVADLIGESFTTFVPLTIGGSFLAGQWVLDYVLALFFGVFFQYAAIRPMERLPRLQIIAKAFKIDFFSLTAWQAGMYGWMALTMFVFHLPMLHNSWSFWFMMQIAMFCGFLTSYPANWLLMKLGIKRGM